MNLPESVLSILAQVPVVVVFAAAYYKHSQIWRDYLRERNTTLEKALEKIAAALDRLGP